MYIKYLFFFLTIFSISYANNFLELEEKRYEENIFNNLDIIDLEKNIEKIDKNIIDIKNISVTGSTILEDFYINSILKKYIGKNKSLNNLINELENKYMDKGYITTRVKIDLEKSNFSLGEISLFIFEGKINKIKFNGKENKLKAYITFPQRKNKILNIRDLDQGIDNLADNSSIDIRPSDKNNYSDILITKEKDKIFTFSINYNDLGQQGTGRHRYKINLNSHNLFKINENIDFIFQEKLQKQKKDRNTKNYSLKISLPYKYYDFSYLFENSKYLRTIKALNRNYYSTGENTYQNFEIKKVIHRNNNHKIDFSTKIALKNVRNFIDDIKLTTGSRKLSVLTLNFSYTGKFITGFLNTDISTSIGLKKFGANIDNYEWYREETSPKAQFRKYNLNLSWYKKIDKFYYKINIGSQFSKDILYSQEKITIGDDTTVRGFKDESLQGDKGIYIKNEIGYKNFKMIEPFIAYDYGYVKNNKIVEEHKKSLQGFSMGLRIDLKNFEASIIISKPIDKPHFFKEKSFVFYTSLTYKF